jgi:hypothetical protein
MLNLKAVTAPNRMDAETGSVIDRCSMKQPWKTVW